MGVRVKKHVNIPLEKVFDICMELGLNDLWMEILENSPKKPFLFDG